MDSTVGLQPLIKFSSVVFSRCSSNMKSSSAINRFRSILNHSTDRPYNVIFENYPIFNLIYALFSLTYKIKSDLLASPNITHKFQVTLVRFGRLPFFNASFDRRENGCVDECREYYELYRIFCRL